MPSSNGINGAAVSAILVGGIFLYAGIKGKSVAETAKALLTGKPAPADGPYFVTPGDAGAGGIEGPVAGANTSDGSIAGNRALGQSLATLYHWSGPEWDALSRLWDKESGWNNKAENPSSGAYGIPQALPPTKMPTSAQAPTSDPSAQIRWGLSYIKARYDSPSAALDFHNANNWY